MVSRTLVAFYFQMPFKNLQTHARLFFVHGALTRQRLITEERTHQMNQRCIQGLFCIVVRKKKKTAVVFIIISRLIGLNFAGVETAVESQTTKS